jgi:uncharacterized protein (DUF4415 family)
MKYMAIRTEPKYQQFLKDIALEPKPVTVVANPKPEIAEKPAIMEPNIAPKPVEKTKPEIIEELRAEIARPVGRPRTGRKVVSMRLDIEVIAKWKATGPGWQARINECLKKAKP